MNRSLLAALALSLVSIALVVPVVLATDDTPPAAPTPAAEPTAGPDTTPTPFDGNGQIVIDPTFIAATAVPASTPDGDARGTSVHPEATPPATDSIQAATVPGTSLHVLLLLAIAGSVLALVALHPPATRRR